MFRCEWTSLTPFSMSDKASVQSVDRALAVLEYLGRFGNASVTELAGALEIHKSTASRILATLEARRFVEQESSRGKYRLGFAIVHLAGAVTEDLELVRLARPICKRLSEETQESVNISVLEQGGVMNIDQVIGSASVVSHNWVGQRNALNCTSTGKVLLAFMPDTELERSLKLPFKRCTEHSVLDANELKQHLYEVRQIGYAYTTEELELGLNAIAAPIYSLTGKVIAALSLSGPSYRLKRENIPNLGEATKQAALDISKRLGYRTE